MIPNSIPYTVYYTHYSYMTKSKKRPTISKSLEQTVLHPTIVDNDNQSNIQINLCETKPQKVKSTTSSKKSKKGSVVMTEQVSVDVDTQPVLPIANIIMHLKCSVTDIEIYRDDPHNHISDPLTYKPTAPPDIMTYHQPEHYSVFDESNTYQPDLNQEDFAYQESKVRLTSSSTPAVTKEIQQEDTHNELDDSHTTSMKEINTKLKKLKLSLFKNMTLVEKKSACFWCTYEFDNTECYIPRYDMDGTMYGYGCFCRPECAAAFLMKENMDDSTKFERYHLLNRVYSKIFNYKKNIKPAPNPYYLLDKYYGNLSIQEYRKLLKSDHLLLVIEKPLTRILPELHEDNEEFLNNIYRNSSMITNVKPTASSSSSTYGTYKVRRQSEKSQTVTKASIIKEHFGITTK